MWFSIVENFMLQKFHLTVTFIFHYITFYNQVLTKCLPYLRQNILRQFRLHHHISGLRTGQVTAPRSISCVENLCVFQFGLMGHSPITKNQPTTLKPNLITKTIPTYSDSIEAVLSMLVMLALGVLVADGPAFDTTALGATLADTIGAVAEPVKGGKTAVGMVDVPESGPENVVIAPAKLTQVKEN